MSNIAAVAEALYNELAELHRLYRTMAEALQELQHKELQHHGRLGG